MPIALPSRTRQTQTTLRRTGAPADAPDRVAEDDHAARHDADVLGVQRQLVPHPAGVGEVLAQAGVAAVGLGAARELRGAARLEDDVLGDVQQRRCRGRGARTRRRSRGSARPRQGARRRCRSREPRLQDRASQVAAARQASVVGSIGERCPPWGGSTSSTGPPFAAYSRDRRDRDRGVVLRVDDQDGHVERRAADRVGRREALGHLGRGPAEQGPPALAGPLDVRDRGERHDARGSARAAPSRAAAHSASWPPAEWPTTATPPSRARPSSSGERVDPVRDVVEGLRPAAPAAAAGAEAAVLEVPGGEAAPRPGPSSAAAARACRTSSASSRRGAGRRPGAGRRRPGRGGRRPATGRRRSAGARGAW